MLNTDLVSCVYFLFHKLLTAYLVHTIVLMLRSVIDLRSCDQHYWTTASFLSHSQLYPQARSYSMHFVSYARAIYIFLSHLAAFDTEEA